MTKPNGHESSNVTSLDEARRSAMQKAKETKRMAAGRSGTRSTRDWVIGGLMIVVGLAGLGAMVLSFARSVSGGGQ